ncbi:MAG: hypothetical protein A3C43_03710 [Candidatus Schekmanbacteria bacterium RIFCSPHIGHO2_02_FULL_38_11]|uniref:Uncharacterized protein n=1 Tax=Candidatus Schekmanbacteria bacterium RIFCSPLOWO2_12_FULL_38_15 TaxID=1817883 RepID=A0A1F7SNR9_9BACT|nr:MAG: hypothetical protein A2043_02810 [Candidatus Schekmanbacteria bacterium GWA2_38_9]OGL50263.1 MAG: hypothetical protein A3H37_00730 [Candidatus Schekmanbacteria bacterium RIFCSPLOWO2_02_FULL_38_14]OGL52324.1 MAG: hypothetical protein A3C43_03710 [Candidatus Schekmanbacteria bacterium RIFCSPHIGHO2_02_FULL_38_11]OGL55426.1 MAG: hypothetical protein A3G31_01270 [Candidatus Schekmanbacteria bacterium RIFCSPLOWO2_12_FULL_38_15]
MKRFQENYTDFSQIKSEQTESRFHPPLNLLPSTGCVITPVLVGAGFLPVGTCLPQAGTCFYFLSKSLGE